MGGFPGGSLVAPLIKALLGPYLGLIKALFRPYFLGGGSLFACLAAGLVWSGGAASAGADCDVSSAVVAGANGGANAVGGAGCCTAVHL